MIEATVAVSSRDRPLRLRWLLNALADQTFPVERFEVVVAHDSSTTATDELLGTHSLRSTGHLRQLRFEDGSVLAGAKRNAAWRDARAPLILFTDDDCRPAADWVEQAVKTAKDHPDAVLQGSTVPDPDESAILRGAPWAHTQLVEPVTLWAETCNIVYPKVVLEQVGGFAEQMQVGEDTDLALRARTAGVPILAAPQLIVFHAVEERFLPGTLRSIERWVDVPLLVKRRPEVRQALWGRVWWKREHAALAALLLGMTCIRSRLAAGTLVLPWAALAMRHRGYGPRGLARSLAELPGRAAIDAAEIAVLARGSARHRTLVL